MFHCSYRKAEESKEAQTKKKKSEGRGSPRDGGRGCSRGGYSNWNQKFPARMNPKEQRQQDECLIEYLQEENQLPVVIFTLVKTFSTRFPWKVKDNYPLSVKNLSQNYKNLSCSVSLDNHFLHYHPDFFHRILAT